ncbi:MAG: ABC transporter permease [Synergistaceae bacterium]|jgi:putative ABC transport system permease protein|nr:ABC transporter permease [Synergistaceae bacterium]
MPSRRMTSFGIAVLNLRRKPLRTFCLVAFVALLSFVLSGGSLLAYSLHNGARSMSERLGADALFVPVGYEGRAAGALLRGEPSAFYFDGDLSERLMHAEGVLRASPQLFIATFDSSHCAFPTQIIGYDPKTDFTIGPWLTRKIPGGPGIGEVVVGSGVNRKSGDEIQFFGRLYRVAGKLDKTGMGFDTSIFMNMETSRAAFKDYAYYAGGKLPDADNAISSITVDIKSGYDPSKFARGVRETFRNELVSVVLMQAMFEDISKELGLSIAIITALMAVFWLLAVGVLAILFTVTLNERRREFGIYRALGATRRKLYEIVLSESCAVSLFGAVSGVLLLCFFVFPFAPLISRSIESAYLQPSFKVLSMILCGGLLVSFLTGPIASLGSAAVIGRMSASAVMKEG